MFHFTKKKAAVLGTVAAIALTAGAAFAYFTASGAGTGNAAVGASSDIVLTSDAISGLFPGGVDVPVDVHVNNPGSGNQYVNVISGTVADSGDCLGEWFEVDSIAYATDVDAGATLDTDTNVRMLDSLTNQDACQSAALTINWSSN